MTPEEKAKELFTQVSEAINEFSSMPTHNISKRVAKFNANQTLAYLHDMGYGLDDAEIIYWLQVLDEIENL